MFIVIQVYTQVNVLSYKWAIQEVSGIPLQKTHIFAPKNLWILQAVMLSENNGNSRIVHKNWEFLFLVLKIDTFGGSFHKGMGEKWKNV